ncbi:non-ribosomal peptide synthetase [Sphaerisporangium fuscum]|uniref:non-ribosomal peptide synthetase n=1 Tax=Sphaerisporangium fuscum TaxID=2835868 RepID=UPI001BDC57C0|nr:non-ribosomal peptide synthetase [Sphaerisporangium fuscum]
MAFEAIQSLVGRAIERWPDRVAVETPRGRLTYAELDARADGVAAALQAAGAGAGTPIPVLAEDRREIIAALLGVLRLGGVFVPLDMSAPAPRLAQMLRDSDPGWAVVGSGVEDAAGAVLAAAAPAAVRVGVDGTGAPVTRHTPGPDDPCAIFYTSGSTGRPKGIVGRLRGIDHFVRWETGLLGVEPGWRVSHVTSPAFDAMLRDVFVPLTTGGTVCVPPPEATGDPSVLTRWIDEERINLVHCVPTLLRGVIREAAAGDREFAALRCVAMSGEKLPPADAARFLDRFGDGVELLNLYGPTETTMTKTFHFVTHADVLRPSIPIGRPIPGAEVLLLNGLNEPAPEGTVGEICIRTAYRSLGYHRDPKATARAFVTNPLTGDPEDVIYRTGDYGRLLPDGSLEFLGRKDHQVKIGGVRVELDGVESVLREHPSVTDAAVVAAEEESGVPYLCAFVELADGADPQDLRGHVRERLPDSAVPAVFVPLPELPRTISGKIDRKALPTPVLRRDTPAEDRVAPRTPTEQALARLWQSILPVSDVDVRESVFEVGGGSLVVFELLSRLVTEFGVQVPLQEFLAAPTIESLAALIEEAILTRDAPDDDFFVSLDGIDETAAVPARRSGD